MWVSELRKGAWGDEVVRLVEGDVRTEINYGYEERIGAAPVVGEEGEYSPRQG